GTRHHLLPMPTIAASASATIAPPAATVYGILADYCEGHPSILPRKYFRNLEVEAGGTGAGTRIRFEMRVLGATRLVRGEVTEPEPGRRLVETYPESGTRTTFLVEPVVDGRAAHVTISTRYENAGLPGWVEWLLVPGLLRRIYRAELANLAAVAQRR